MTEIWLSVSRQRAAELQRDGWTIVLHTSWPHAAYAYAMAWRVVE